MADHYRDPWLQLAAPIRWVLEFKGSEGIWEVDGNRVYIETRPKSPINGMKPLNGWNNTIILYGKICRERPKDRVTVGWTFLLQAFVKVQKEHRSPPLDAYDTAAWSARNPAFGGFYCQWKWKYRIPRFYPW